MSIRTYLKAAAVALPLAFGGVKAAAQSPTRVLKAAEKVVSTDTLKTMENKAADARTLVIKKFKGQYQGSVKSGKLADGNLSYEEKGRTVPVASILNQKSSLSVDGSYVSGSKLPSAGYRLAGNAQKGNDAFSAAGVVSKDSKQTDVIGDVAYTRVFPLSQDLSATGSIGVEGAMHKVKDADSYGSLYPRLTAGLKYRHNFDNGAFVGVKGEVGGAPEINFKSETLKTFNGGKFIADGEVEAGYKHISGFVAGGQDAAMGSNIRGGVRIHF